MTKKKKSKADNSIKKSPDLGFDPDILHFVPLGGAGHFGANLNLFIFNNKMLIIDLGMGFNELNLPGIDLMLPDISFVRKHKDKLVGIVATHAHEDHIGGIAYVWQYLQCPVYATPFTATVLKKKFAETGIEKKVPLNIMRMNDSLFLNPFDLELISVAHSIPEPNAIALRVKGYDPIIHTGDWKIDDDPVVGNKVDKNRIKTLGKEGVLAVIGDSTNAHISGHSKSEGDVLKSFKQLFSECKNRIAVVCFSSNIARLESIARAAQQNNRHVALVGRSLWRMVDSAKENGLLKGFSEFLSPKDASYLEQEKVVYICTGSQGEARAALAKIVHKKHPEISLEKGDNVIYSSRAIPGNEKAIFSLKNALVKQGVNVIDEYDKGPIHVSGHPYSEELALLYSWLKPKLAIPVHGEFMMQSAHADIAKNCDVQYTVIPENGDVIAIENDGSVEIIERIPTNFMVIDGQNVRAIDDEALVNRQRLNVAGTATVSIVIDRRGQLVADPVVSSFGVIDGHDDEDGLYNDVEDIISENLQKTANDDDKIAQVARLSVRRFFKNISGKKPMTHVHLVRLED